MIVSIHQPNYLPWAGFFHKMSLCDTFVLLDTVPFSKNSYQNRCSIKTSQGAQWLTVPVVTAGRLGQATNLVEIADQDRVASKHWRTIDLSYRRAPYFDTLAQCIHSAYSANWKLLADLNIQLITRIAELMEVRTPLVRASSLNVGGSRSDLLAAICHALGATEYLSGPSGRNYLDLEPFAAHGIAVSFHRFTPPTYPQLYGEFVPALSIIDLVANCGPSSWEQIAEQGGRSAE